MKIFEDTDIWSHWIAFDNGTRNLFKADFSPFFCSLRPAESKIKIGSCPGGTSRHVIKTGIWSSFSWFTRTIKHRKPENSSVFCFFKNKIKIDMPLTLSVWIQHARLEDFKIPLDVTVSSRIQALGLVLRCKESVSSKYVCKILYPASLPACLPPL